MTKAFNPQQMKVLIVEDEPIVAMAICMAVEDLGYEVVGPAHSLDAALQLIERDTPQIGLLDIDLDRAGDGLIVAKVLSTRGMPVVFISGHEDMVRKNAKLAVGYIGKPAAPEAIADSIAVADAVVHGINPPPPKIPSGFVLFQH